MSNEALPSVSAADLDHVTGGFDIGQIGQQLGGLVDRFTGGAGKGAQMGGQIGELIQRFMGGAGGQGPTAGTAQAGGGPTGGGDGADSTSVGLGAGIGG